MDNDLSTIENRRKFIINVVYFCILIAIVFALLKYAVPLFLPFVIAFALSFMINPLIDKISKKLPKKHKKFMAFFIMLLFYVLITVILILIIMGIFSLSKYLIAYISETDLIDNIHRNYNDIINTISVYLSGDIAKELSSFVSSLSESIQKLLLAISSKLGSWIAGATKSVPAFFVAFIFTILLSFFVTMQYSEVTEFIKRQAPNKLLKIADELKDILKTTVLKYIRAMLMIMLITGIELFIGFEIIGIENGLLIAIGIAVMDAIPVLGTGLVMIPWIIFKFIQSDFHMGISLLILYGIVTVIRNIIEPKIVGDNLGINPIVSVVSIYIGFKTMGVFGMIIMPTVAQVLIELHKREVITLFKRDDDKEADIEKTKLEETDEVIDKDSV